MREGEGETPKSVIKAERRKTSTSRLHGSYDPEKLVFKHSPNRNDWPLHESTSTQSKSLSARDSPIPGLTRGTEKKYPEPKTRNRMLYPRVYTKTGIMGPKMFKGPLLKQNPLKFG